MTPEAKQLVKALNPVLDARKKSVSRLDILQALAFLSLKAADETPTNEMITKLCNFFIQKQETRQCLTPNNSPTQWELPWLANLKPISSSPRLSYNPIWQVLTMSQKMW